MVNKEDVSKNEEPFNPDTALNRLLEISNKITELVNSDKKDTIFEIRVLHEEMRRMVKLRKDYYEEQLAELKKKPKDNN